MLAGQIRKPVLGFAQSGTECICTAFVYKVVGVNLGAIGARKRKYARRNSLGQDNFQTSEGCLLAGCVSVEYQVGGVGVSGKNARVRFGQCRSRGCHHVRDAALIQANHVEVAFHDNHRVFFRDALAALMQTEQNIALVVQRRFRAVHVLRTFKIFILA